LNPHTWGEILDGRHSSVPHHPYIIKKINFY